jgi:hypothetical protein
MGPTQTGAFSQKFARFLLAVVDVKSLCCRSTEGTYDQVGTQIGSDIQNQVHSHCLHSITTQCAESQMENKMGSPILSSGSQVKSQFTASVYAQSKGEHNQRYVCVLLQFTYLITCGAKESGIWLQAQGSFWHHGAPRNKCYLGGIIYLYFDLFHS